MRRQPRLPGWAAALLGIGALVGASGVIARTVEPAALAEAWDAVAASPDRALAALGFFGLAFAIRAAVWRRLLPSLSFGQSLAAIHLALGGNHVLPFRMGEPLRVASAVRRAGVPLAAAAASTLTLRAADLLALLVLGLAASPTVLLDLAGGWAWVGIVGLGAACGVGLWWLRSVVRSGTGAVRMPDATAVAGTVVAWTLEAFLVWQSAAWSGIHLGPAEAVLVTSTSVVAQVAAVAPGGLGTYEAAAVAAYTALGEAAGPALVAALTAHALKTLYSLVMGAVALAWPRPAFFGRLRMDAPSPCGVAQESPSDGPVILVLPAHDEEASVAAVVGRTPRRVCGRDVRVLVVDDGSSDATAARASSAGAEVVRFPANRGLGAAVRTGLAEAVARGACAVAFCDADGEYAPEELAGIVAPILEGRADYVVGSRFAGGPRRMLPHRRLGNVLLTKALSLVARRRISDGQSGYRALSRRAATQAEIIHDYNYAQVLTLDLLGKGFRYLEVPISYAFRREGTSFVKLGRYLRRVVPAVYRELNAGPGPVSVLDDVAAEPLAGAAPALIVEGAVGA